MALAASGRAIRRHDHTVCIVDDDAMVCDSLATLLDAHGFKPLAHAPSAAFLADDRRWRLGSTAPPPILIWIIPRCRPSWDKAGLLPHEEANMRSHYHAVIWIDHLEARIFQFGREDVNRLVLHPDNPTRHIHHKANTIGGGHTAEDQDFLRRVVETVAGAGAVLITGPANTKTELLKHIHHHAPHLLDIIAGVETVDHPSDRSLVAYARHYFKTADHMKPQIP